MFRNGVSENTLLLSMRSDTLWTDPTEYKETYINPANQKDEYEKNTYPDGVWILRLDTKRLKGISPNNRMVVGRFKNKEMLMGWLKSRLDPVEVAPKFYSKTCDCLSWQYQLVYRQCSGVVFEACSNCGNPTKEAFREPLNKLIVDSFDLDEFLGL